MARGDSKKVSEYDLKSGDGAYNNSSDTFAYLLVTNTYASIDADTALNAASFTGATVGGNYAGKTSLANVTWTRLTNVSTFNFDDIPILSNAGNPTDAKCLVILNDTSAADDAMKIVDLTTDGSTPVDLTAGDFTYTVAVAGSATVTTNA